MRIPTRDLACRRITFFHAPFLLQRKSSTLFLPAFAPLSAALTLTSPRLLRRTIATVTALKISLRVVVHYYPKRIDTGNNQYAFRTVLPGARTRTKIRAICKQGGKQYQQKHEARSKTACTAKGQGNAAMTRKKQRRQ